MVRVRNPSGATSTTEAKKENGGRKGEVPNKQEKTNQNKQRTSIVLCQHYEEHQLFINIAVQISKANKGQAGMAIISFSGQLEMPALRVFPVNMVVPLAVHGRRYQQIGHILKHKI